VCNGGCAKDACVAAVGIALDATGGLDTGGGPGVGGGIAIGGITGRDRGAPPAPTSTDRLTTTVGVGFNLGEDAGAAGAGGALGAAILVVAVLTSVLSGTRFEKVLIEDF
jgi:hypothetical protein